MTDYKNVFISSTYIDLVSYRQKVIETIQKSNMHPVAMEFFGSKSGYPIQTCHDAFLESDIFIGIYAHRYGFIPDAKMTYNTRGEIHHCDGKTSVTHFEYIWANKYLNDRMLLFVIQDDTPWTLKFIDKDDSERKLSDFKNTILRHQTVDFFNTEDDLAKKVATALLRLNGNMPSTLPINTINMMLSKLNDKIDEYQRICLNCQRLHTLDLWDEVINASWFNESSLKSPISDIEKLFRLLIEYTQLPRSRGDGHRIERWLRDNHFENMLKKAKKQMLDILHINGVGR